MVIATVHSKNNILIRLTSERWLHIRTSHKEIDPDDFASIMNVVKDPDAVLQGDAGELLAIKKRSRKNAWIVVVYKEIGQSDGFIITAYITSVSQWLFKREVLWSKE